MRWCALLVLLGCTPREIRTRAPAASALAEARGRLVERGILLDSAGTRPDRIRTAFFCHHETDDWDQSFQTPDTPPVPFEFTGTFQAQAERKAECPLLFQVEIISRPDGPGGALEVQSAWWTVEDRGCTPVGEKLVGEHRCSYGYHGTRRRGSVERHIYGILAGI